MTATGKRPEPTSYAFDLGGHKPSGAWAAPARLTVFWMGPRVRKLRIQRGWSQMQLAAKSGLPQDKISGIENNTNRASITFKNAIKLARALDTSLDYLGGLSHDPTPRR